MIPRIDAASSADALHRDFLDAIRRSGFAGETTVRDGDRVTFATDNSIYRIEPQAIVFPRTASDVATLMRLLAEPMFADVAIAARGGATGTNGQSLTSGVVVDVSRHMTDILEINVAERWVRVQVGVVKDQLNAALRPHGLFFAPELSTSNRATIGGMINTDASGQGSCLYGKTRDHVLELTIVLSGGVTWTSRPVSDEELAHIRCRPDIVGKVHEMVEAIRREHAAAIDAHFPKLNRCLTGYDLAHIRDHHGRFDLNSVLCGSEGTLGLMVEAKLNVLPIPTHSALVNLRYESFDAGLRDARALVSVGASSIETIDSKVLALAQADVVWESVREFFPDDGCPTHGVNMIEFVGHSPEEVEEPLGRLCALLEGAGLTNGRMGFTVARGEGAVRRVWDMRKRAVGLLGNMQGDERPIAFVEDAAVPPDRLADFIGDFRAILDARGLDYGMFGHVDAGVLHVRPAMDMRAPGSEAVVRDVTDAVVELTRRYGGLLWGEHGKGVRSEYAPAFFGDLYPCVQAVKRAFDPLNQLNPGKVAAPDGRALLRIDAVPTRGQSDREVSVSARAGYREAIHCNGTGVCFDWDPDSVMCPSWKGLRERRHSPKGRATLVKEWLRRLSTAGVDPVREAAKLRSTNGLLAFSSRLFNSATRAYAPSDFSDEVKEAMDGCLACKACVGGCPIKVNVPSFRAKFLELYHGRYLRPLKDHLVAALEPALPVMARAPRLANALMGSRPARTLTRAFGLVDLPELSDVDVVRALAIRGVAIATPAALAELPDDERRRSVVIVQDAFTSYYEGRLVLDTLDLVSALGFRPWLAPYLPNGKPLQVHGFLEAFERVSARMANMLRGLAATGVDLVGVDPAMTLAFRSEYGEALGPNSVPRVLLPQEWLARNASSRVRAGGEPYHLLAHCTERATVPTSASDWIAVFSLFGLDLVMSDAGCCGMAGTYGHEARNRGTSEKIYDLSWGRRLAEATDSARVLATGFSCRCQAKRFGGVALHHPIQALLAHVRGRDQAGDDGGRLPTSEGPRLMLQAMWHH